MSDGSRTYSGQYLSSPQCYRLRITQRTILVVHTIHHATLPSIILHEHFNLTPDCIGEIEARTSLDIHTECHEESNCKADSLAVEIPIQRDVGELLRTIVSVLDNAT